MKSTLITGSNHFRSRLFLFKFRNIIFILLDQLSQFNQAQVSRSTRALVGFAQVRFFLRRTKQRFICLHRFSDVL